MPAHTVPAYAHAVYICGGNIGGNPGGKLITDIALHLKMISPRLLGGVKVKSRAFAKIIALIIRHIITARGGVGRYNNHAELGRQFLRACLCDKILLCAGQAREKDKDRGGFSALWRKDAKAHIAITGGRIMLMDGLSAAVHFILADECHIIVQIIKRLKLYNAPNALTFMHEVKGLIYIL